MKKHHRILLYNRLCQGNQRSSEAQNLQDLIENLDLCVSITFSHKLTEVRVSNEGEKKGILIVRTR